MSVQDGERLATKQDLADMYQGILPYLGGMPEMVANKFSKGDLYSTEERLIGQWIDGKPLYSKTFNSTTGNTTSQTLISNLGSLNIDTMVSMTGKLVNSGLTVSIPAYLTATGYVGMYHDPTGNSIVAFVGSDWYNQPVTITLQYTKTTDTAISIGDETDYSTTEKIVGTWIDGSPVYQKTFKFKLTALKTEISIGASVEDAFVTYGYVNNGAGYLLPKALYLSGDMYINSGVHKSNNTVYIETNINELIGKDCVLVVQYTKTT